MKHLLIAILLSLVLAYPTSAQEKMTDRGHDGLAGQVRAVHIEEGYFSNKEGKLAESRIHTLSIAYDPDGHMIEPVFYNDKCAWAKRLYSYDAEGNREEALYHGDAINGDPAQPGSVGQVKPPSTITFNFNL